MGERTPGDAPAFEYDIAVSFAGEDRDYVEEVVRLLKGRGFKVFYDQDLQAELWGVNLVGALQAAYTRRARFAALFISRHYAEKKWPTHELQSAQARAVEQSSPYILPIRLDDTPLPGLHSTIGYIDARRVGIAELVELFSKKLADDVEVAAPSFNGRVPRTARETASLLAERPSLWEYILYAGALHQGFAGLEEKYRDHVLEYSRRNGVVLDDADAFSWIVNNFSLIESVTNSLDRILSVPAQDAAFGLPGEPGDPDRILHLADRFAKVYEECLDWAAKLRGTTISDPNLREAADAQARLVDQPIQVMRDFVATFVKQADTWTDRLAAGEPVEHDVTITFEMDAEQTEVCMAAVRRYASS